ncbi:hypothetical protein IW261DRAFT_1665943 [Armillaria novae-zelandiae]|uniref:NADH-ubiquinone oxidoreductase MLRQ subunit n=1 Tax=Armillaria novae-zelandiae TaxID=153914 RepID=A0AA39NUZ4_9AGAR|nr:hypothetical protein IW261DRAFT_1665943 [Armillaria novae-zelandiae]
MFNVFRQSIVKHWLPVEAAPFIILVGGMLSGSAWYLSRLAMGPTIQWTRSNPTPWNTIQPNQGTKLIEVNQKFDKKWSRDKL